MLLIILIFLIIIVGTPILLFIGYNKLKVNGHRKTAHSLAIIFISIIAYIGYETFIGIYPDDDWYKENFQINLGVDFPKKGEIIYKDAGYPDLHGKFISAFSFEVEPDAFKKILNTFPANSNYCNTGSSEIDHVMQHYNKKNISRTYKKADEHSGIYLMFLNDGKTIIYLLFNGIQTGC